MYRISILKYVPLHCIYTIKRGGMHWEIHPHNWDVLELFPLGCIGKYSLTLYIPQAWGVFLNTSLRLGEYFRIHPSGLGSISNTSFGLGGLFQIYPSSFAGIVQCSDNMCSNVHRSVSPL